MNDQQTNTTQSQNTQINNIQTPAKPFNTSSNTTTSPLSPEKDKKQQDKNNKILRIIAIFFFILILGELGFVFVFHNASFRQLLPSSSFFLSRFQSNNNTKNSNTSSLTPTTTPAPQSNIIIPVPTGLSVGGTGATSVFTVRVEKVIKNPGETSGDKPLKGLQYIEFDLSVTNKTNKTTLIPGMFYIQDASTGKLFLPADMFGYLKDSKVIFSSSQKEVVIRGKQSLYAAEINPGQTVTRYLIYQILPGEKGQLIWDDSYILTEIPSGEKVAQTNILSQTVQGKLPQPLQFTAYDPEHNNKITVFSFK